MALKSGFIVSDSLIYCEATHQLANLKYEDFLPSRESFWAINSWLLGLNEFHPLELKSRRNHSDIT
jgi:hypothetical protein